MLAQSGTGSQTGTGPVTVKMGTLGGDGLGARATLAPSIEQDGAEQIFTTKKKLTFEGDGDFVVKVNSDTVTFDQVIAKGVTITPGATLSVSDLGNTVLPIGTSVTLINNTSASPISGTFAGLPEGATYTVGNNTWRITYQGGDGNNINQDTVDN